MPRTIEVNLDGKIVVPLVDIIRQQVSRFERCSHEAAAGSLLAAHRQFEAQDLADLHALTELFPPDFSASPVLRVSETQVPAILRACTVLRFDLRRRPFESIPDATMESNKQLNCDFMPEELRPALMCYLFLATIQELALEHFALPPSGPTRSSTPFWRRVLNALGGRQPAALTSLPSPNAVPAAMPSWQVVVMNDSVNLMNYVSSIFHHVIGLTMNESIKKMREVHESKESTVWTGGKDEAEAYVAALRSWHLNAVLRPVGVSDHRK